MDKIESNSWDAFKSVYYAMGKVAGNIEDTCPDASSHIMKKLRHAWNFLVAKKKRKQALKSDFFASDSDLEKRRK